VLIAHYVFFRCAMRPIDFDIYQYKSNNGPQIIFLYHLNVLGNLDIALIFINIKVNGVHGNAWRSNKIK